MAKKIESIEKTEKPERIIAAADRGLSSEQAAMRMEQGLNNRNTQPASKSIKRIFYDNIVTLFNVINLILGLAVFLVGSYKNMLFLGVMFFNTVIGIVQEIRAKKAIDRLAIVSASKITVIRDGEKQQLGVEDAVLDDIVEFSQGNQISVDSIVIEGECEVNESLLTGESDAVRKCKGDMVLSGSFVISGKCLARVEHVGEENYAAKISAEAKYAKKINSEIMITLQTIIRVLTYVIFPLSLLLFLRQYLAGADQTAVVYSVLGQIPENLRNVVVSTVASMTSIIPEGLMLLTSTVLAVSVIRLSQHKVLVQELYCIETLARVDVLCLDKTGTITEGKMETADVIPYGEAERENVEEILTELTTALDDTNATFMALRDKYGTAGALKAEQVIPFSSEKKWSGAYFPGEGSYLMGAPEFILKEIPASLKELIDRYAGNFRVIIVARSPKPFREKELPEEITVAGIVLLNDKIRPEAPDTLRYFADQKVEVKIISGDNPVTVSDVARRAGVAHYDKYIDATQLQDDEAIEKAMQEYTVFGRVTPAQKKKFVLALKGQGHTVAMTGDGVNDVLALKEADCSIAMAAGSDAARNVSQLVLLDSNFASMPKVVAEGRRSINNIQRSATLFIAKTVFSILLALLFIVVSTPYPFMPIQYTLINCFTIGTPSLILALEPNKERIKGVFLFNIMKTAVPTGLTVTLSIVLCVISAGLFGLTDMEYSTLCVLVLSAVSFMLLFRISRPFNALRTALFVTMVTGITIGILCFRDFMGINLFSMAEISLTMLLIFLGIIVIAAGMFLLLNFWTERSAPAAEEYILKKRRESFQKKLRKK